MFRWSSS